MNKRFIKNVVFDFAVFYSLIAVYMMNEDLSAYAENALSFIGIFSLVIGILTALLSDSIAKSFDKDGYKKRTKLHSAYGAITTMFEVLIVSSFGWYWVASGFLILYIASESVNSKVTE